MLNSNLKFPGITHHDVGTSVDGPTSHNIHELCSHAGTAAKCAYTQFTRKKCCCEPILNRIKKTAVPRQRNQYSVIHRGIRQDFYGDDEITWTLSIGKCLS